MAQLTPSPKQQFFDASGNMLAGGKLYTYIAGTTTPLATYSDAAGLVANANPIILDARGEATIYLLAQSYKFVLKTSSDATIYTQDSIETHEVDVGALGTSVTALIASLESDLAASSGASMVGYLPAGAGSAASTVQAKLRQKWNANDFTGVDSTGTTDSTSGLQAALNAAAGGSLEITPGTYLCEGLTVPDGTNIVGHGAGSILKKNANGDVIASLGTHAILSNFAIDGDGANFIGRGIVIEDTSATVTTAWWRYLNNMTIYDTESYCVEFVGAISGYLSQIIGGTMTVTDDAVPAVKFPGTAKETNGNRRMIGVMTFSTQIVDLAGSDNSCIMGCEGNSPLWSDNTAKARVIGNRIPLGDGIILNGTQGVFANNIMAETSMELAANLFNTTIIGNMFPSGHTLTDNTVESAGNDIEVPRQFYTPVVTVGGAGFTIGDGTLEGTYRVRGDRCMVHIKLVIGSTTVLGTGAWSFSVPKKARRNAVGQIYIEDASPVAVYPGVAMIAVEATTVRCVVAGFTSAYAGSATPIAWAVGDKMDIEIEYTVK